MRPLNFSILVCGVLMMCLTMGCAKLSKYCSLCENHTMCKYHGPGPNCEKIGGYGVTHSEKKQILDLHNWYRKIVANGYEKSGSGGSQPKAADMMKLQWDDDLAEVAQRWADQCRLEHDTCRADPRWKVGQNIYWKWKYPTHNVNWTEAIASWYDEVSLFNPNEVRSYRFDSKTGHYSQLVWHDTHFVGCGRRDYGLNKLYVCNYGPTGNWINEPVYTVGEPCSKCPQGCSCDEYLCGKFL
ncbi:Ves G 5 allergen precursor, putative [Pediculus humanus corporis]|uniref:Ves G 5 allergen, putative n=1 Tax=Pediculus humanus subsp. corporis TaxID=121224 RepID=E0VS96_PEDHC|nr:Ves G 5 allergen precursor, putative [Pediculus humanus corporis]EEB16252.1 Ves G 5 allergen precursor, putative [Pediculus humanus corporis]